MVNAACRHGTQMEGSGAASAPALAQSAAGQAPASASAPAKSDSEHSNVPQSLAEAPSSTHISTQEATNPSRNSEELQTSDRGSASSTAAAPASSTEAPGFAHPHVAHFSQVNTASEGLLKSAAAPVQATAAHAPEQLAGMYGQLTSTTALAASHQALEEGLAESGALTQNPASAPEARALEDDLLSAAYNAGYQAGYEAARKVLVRHVSIATTPSEAPSPQPSDLSHELPQVYSRPPAYTSQASELPPYSQHVEPQPQSYGQNGGVHSPRAGNYGNHYPMHVGDSTQASAPAAAYSPEVSPAQASYSYSHQAGSAYQPAETQKLLQARAHGQAARFQRTHLDSSRPSGAYSEAPGPGEHPLQS